LNNNELKNLRKYLIDNHLLKQIISLPSGVFLPYTEAKASIFVLQGFNNEPIDKIRYTIIKNDGFTLTRRRRKIAEKINDLEEYLSDNLFETKELSVKEILKEKNYSFIWFKYFSEIPENYILLREILQEESIKNKELHETATVTKHKFWGIISGEEYWGDSFMSVTSESNEDYKVVNYKSLVYSTARANVGSIGINLTNKKFAVSVACTTCKVVNKKFLPEYVFLCIRSKRGIQNVKERSFGSVRQTLRFEDLLTISIPNIPIEEQQKIVDEAMGCYNDFVKCKDIIDRFDAEEKSNLLFEK
jgi:restriction endonuclease S subunit